MGITDSVAYLAPQNALESVCVEEAIAQSLLLGFVLVLDAVNTG